MVESDGTESERSLRRRKFGVFLDHSVLESVKRAHSSELSQASRDGKDRLEVGSASGRSADDMLLHFKGNHSLRSPPNSDGSMGSVGNGGENPPSHTHVRVQNLRDRLCLRAMTLVGR